MVEITIENFNIKQIAESGQCFRMHNISNNKYLVLSTNKGVIVEQDGLKVKFYCEFSEYNSFWKSYFDIDNNIYEHVIRECYFRGIVDIFAFRAARYSSGIRILKQDLWEMIISYLIARCKKIEQISLCIERMCQTYGRKVITYNGVTYYSFPNPYSITQGGIEPLIKCGLGFRAKDILKISQAAISGEFDTNILRNMTYQQGYDYLIQNSGIGPKVANCILLYGCNHTESVPRDTWINKVQEENYKGEEPWWFNYPWGGIVQQYVFYYKRNYKNEKEQKTMIKIEQPEECIFGHGVCCYPIDDCENCPARPENNDPYWNTSKAEIK